MIQKNTAVKIFSETVIDIPETTSNTEEAIHIITNYLVDNMPYCRITRLYEDDTAPPPSIQSYKNDGKEILLLKMDFYVIDNSNSSYTSDVLNKEYSWLFIRDNEQSSWELESHGYIL